MHFNFSTDNFPSDEKNLIFYNLFLSDLFLNFDKKIICPGKKHTEQARSLRNFNRSLRMS